MKKIGITQRIHISEHGEVRTQIDINLYKFIYGCGYIPIGIPYFNEKKNNSLIKLKNWLEKTRINGIVLSGGEDIGIFKLRDFSENFLIKYSIKKKIPLFGICRGMQIIGLFFKSKIIPVKNHVKKSHAVYSKKNRITVNSFHNFSLESCPKNFNIEYRALDGNIESIESKQKKIYACMWHPERYNKFRKSDKINFKKIFGK